MAVENWLPIGFKLPDDALCRRTIFGDELWQIVKTDGGGAALIADAEIIQRWTALKLIDQGAFHPFSFGPDEFFEFSCGPGEALVPVNQADSPNTHREAMAFATALKATRDLDPESPLQDAIYVEELGRLLPTFSLSARTDDDVILGYWLTGGAQVSAKSTRRLNQMMSWISPTGLKDVVSASGVAQRAKAAPSDVCEESDSELDQEDAKAAEVDADEEGSGLERGVPFALAGRPLLENFFNEHVVDIVRNKERYAALGIGFPSAVVLHGPPGSRALLERIRRRVPPR